MTNPPGTSPATLALLAFAGADPGIEPPLGFDGADVSAAALGARVADAPWWDPQAGGLQLGGRDLKGASLRGADLTGAVLDGAQLGQAACSGIVLHRARLEQAVLHGADLIGGTLTEVDAGEADFGGAMLEDVNLASARLRFATFDDAVMDGADLSHADLWGASMTGIAAERALFRSARLDEAKLARADLAGADFTGATLRRADLAGATLRGATLRGAVMDGATLRGADLRDAILPHVVLTSCDLHQVRWANAWLERTRMRASQLGGAIGEEAAGEYEAAREGYIVLEQNFRTLGLADDESWAFRRRRRMGKRMHREQAHAALRRRDLLAAADAGARWLSDQGAEWLCDYGESVPRVLRAFLLVLLVFAGLYWATGCLVGREGVAPGSGYTAVNYLLFSLDSMTTVGTSEVALRPGGQLGTLLSSLQTVLGTVLLGLFGFVLGVRMRN